MQYICEVEQGLCVSLSADVNYERESLNYNLTYCNFLVILTSAPDSIAIAILVVFHCKSNIRSGIVF